MFNLKDRQRIINDYLNLTGRNQFTPAEFLDWLKDNPKHEVYNLFFGQSDEDAAQAHRESLVRKWVSGLRITVLREVPEHRRVSGIAVAEYRLPMMISPLAGRRAGGGYEPTDPDDDRHLYEMVRHAASALASWIERYEGAAGLLGVDVSRAKEIVGSMEARLLESA